MKNLSEKVRGLIAKNFEIEPGKISLQKESAQDGSVKLLIRMKDGQEVETVYIPRGKRKTVCVSTQVGCKFKCAFCASGKAGFLRNLTAGEILSQVLRARDLSDSGNLTHIVFMGIGEPLDNMDNVLTTLNSLNDPDMLHLGARRMTISTCGVVPKIYALAEKRVRVELSVSLHGVTDAVRSRIMPVNRRYPVKELMSACDHYTGVTGREVTYEYLLAEGLNAGIQDATALAKKLMKRRCKVNLIPLNPIAEFPYKRPNYRTIQAFQNALEERHVTTTVRFSRGTDIDAACGQLRSIRLRQQKKVDTN